MNIVINDRVKKYLNDMGRNILTVYTEKIGSC